MLWASSPMNCWPASGLLAGQTSDDSTWKTTLLPLRVFRTGCGLWLPSVCTRLLGRGHARKIWYPRLQDSLRPTSPAGSRLQQANTLAVERQAEDSRQRSAIQAEAERRRALYADAEQALENILALLDRRIKDDASAVDTRQDVSDMTWKLNAGSMSVDFRKRVELGKDQPLPFEVIAHTQIAAYMSADRRGYAGRSHSLWFCDAQEQGVFRWFETAFMTLGSEDGYAPFAMTPDSRDAAIALSSTMHVYQAAWPFTPIDQGGEDEFIERWIGWFGDAAQGQLRYPNRLPELDPHGSWRRGR